MISNSDYLRYVIANEFGMHCLGRPMSQSLMSFIVQRSIAQQLNLREKDVDERLIEVTSLLPGLITRLQNIKASSVAQLCDDPRVSFKTLSIVDPKSSSAAVTLKYTSARHMTPVEHNEKAS